MFNARAKCVTGASVTIWQHARSRLHHGQLCFFKGLLPPPLTLQELLFLFLIITGDDEDNDDDNSRSTALHP